MSSVKFWTYFTSKLEMHKLIPNLRPLVKWIRQRSQELRNSGEVFTSGAVSAKWFINNHDASKREREERERAGRWRQTNSFLPSPAQTAPTKSSLLAQEPTSLLTAMQKEECASTFPEDPSQHWETQAPTLPPLPLQTQGVPQSGALFSEMQPFSHRPEISFYSRVPISNIQALLPWWT